MSFSPWFLSSSSCLLLDGGGVCLEPRRASPALPRLGVLVINTSNAEHLATAAMCVLALEVVDVVGGDVDGIGGSGRLLTTAVARVRDRVAAPHELNGESIRAAGEVADDSHGLRHFGSSATARLSRNPMTKLQHANVVTWTSNMSSHSIVGVGGSSSLQGRI
ncbi:hypothetical protein OsI_32824 [Oryza sativa Indica Group]|uniref:Uncharacterized protein n=1 Tax=Oryza sativa subsp. indica TaxID=39946 RepID=A2Z5A0_ORYSI|nr:hypothetical protein OsI_32824 [Oryza sativa Indica Group]